MHRGGCLELYYCNMVEWCWQGCGLGLEMYQRLGLVSRKIVNVSVSGVRPLGLGHLRPVRKTNFRPNCAGHSTQCERALDDVNLCCSYYYSSY